MDTKLNDDWFDDKLDLQKIIDNADKISFSEEELQNQKEIIKKVYEVQAKMKEKEQNDK